MGGAGRGGEGEGEEGRGGEGEGKGEGEGEGEGGGRGDQGRTGYLGDQQTDPVIQSAKYAQFLPVDFIQGFPVQKVEIDLRLVR